MNEESDALYTMDTTTGIRGPVSDDKPMATIYVNSVPTPLDVTTVGATVSTSHVFSPLAPGMTRVTSLDNTTRDVPFLLRREEETQPVLTPVDLTVVRRIVAEELAKVRASLVRDVGSCGL